MPHPVQHDFMSKTKYGAKNKKSPDHSELCTSDGTSIFHYPTIIHFHGLKFQLKKVSELINVNLSQVKLSD